MQTRMCDGVLLVLLEQINTLSGMTDRMTALNYDHLIRISKEFHEIKTRVETQSEEFPVAVNPKPMSDLVESLMSDSTTKRIDNYEQIGKELMPVLGREATMIEVAVAATKDFPKVGVGMPAMVLTTYNEEAHWQKTTIIAVEYRRADKPHGWAYKTPDGNWHQGDQVKGPGEE